MSMFSDTTPRAGDDVRITLQKILQQTITNGVPSSSSSAQTTYHTTSATVAEPGATFYLTGAGAQVTGTAPTPRNGGRCEIAVFYETGTTRVFELNYTSGLGLQSITYAAVAGFLRVLILRGVNSRWILEEQLLKLTST